MASIMTGTASSLRLDRTTEFPNTRVRQIGWIDKQGRVWIEVPTELVASDLYLPLLIPDTEITVEP